MIVPPDVDSLPLRHPAQLASDVTSMIEMGACQQCLHTNRGLPFKYLPMRLRRTQARAVGLDMSLQTSFTAYWMSGLSGCR